MKMDMEVERIHELDLDKFKSKVCGGYHYYHVFVDYLKMWLLLYFKIFFILKYIKIIFFLIFLIYF